MLTATEILSQAAAHRHRHSLSTSSILKRHVLCLDLRPQARYQSPTPMFWMRIVSVAAQRRHLWLTIKFLSMIHPCCVHSWWKVAHVEMCYVATLTAKCVNCAAAIVSIPPTKSSESNTTPSALRYTSKKWKLLFSYRSQRRKPAEFALRSCGRRTAESSGSAFCPTVITVSVSNAFASGDKRSSSTTKSSVHVPSVASVRTLCVPVAFGLTVPTRRRNW